MPGPPDGEPGSDRAHWSAQGCQEAPKVIGGDDDALGAVLAILEQREGALAHVDRQAALNIYFDLHFDVHGSCPLRWYKKEVKRPPAGP